jgi:CDP-paratose 2-epimerase
MRILVTGGAGFVGAALARYFRDLPGHEVVAMDNLHRRGSEQNLLQFKKLGIEFVHGDIRSIEDFAALPGQFDLFVEASAEPSVHAGAGPQGDPRYLLQTNLFGTANCLEYARRHAGALVFLSTSRVYSLEPLRQLALQEGETRLELRDPTGTGLSLKGLNEQFPTHLPRTLYGASKLASEMLVQEYVQAYGLKAVINRCGVIAGPGQFGKVDQGVFTLWLAHHYFGLPLKYTGFGGKGKQVRDILHPRDLFELLRLQLEKISTWGVEPFNVGGGAEVSTSLLEWTREAEAVTGRSLDIQPVPETAGVDIPWYLSDSSRAAKAFGWKPRISRARIAAEIHEWLKDNEETLRPLFTK